MLPRQASFETLLLEILNQAREAFGVELAEIVLLPSGDEDIALISSIRAGAETALMVPAARWGLAEMLSAVSNRRGTVAFGPGRGSAAPVLTPEGLRPHECLLGQIETGEGERGVLAIANPDEEGGLSGVYEDSFAALLVEANAALAGCTPRWRFEHIALHDGLTGLANQVLLNGRLSQAISHCDRPQFTPTLLRIDVDDFKAINRQVGHGAGDRLLVALAERLRACIRPHDTAARIGSDEFAILIEDTKTRKQAARIAERILAALRTPFPVSSDLVEVKASIGLALSHSGQDTPETLLEGALTALQRAKTEGKCTYAFFDPGLTPSSVADHERAGRLRIDLRNSISDSQLTVVYQPWVDLASGEMVAAEALVRWNHPELGEILPSEFIGLGEETGLILPIGVQVLGSACLAAVEWGELRPSPPLAVSVNISGDQLQHPQFPPEVSRSLQTAGLSPHQLILEINESVLSQQNAAGLQVLADLRSLGVRVAIDDFGSGPSPLARLDRMPVDILKIARPFVEGVATNPGRVAFLGAVMRLGTSLGLTMVIQGIESKDQAATVGELGCNVVQGYLFAHPMTKDEVSQLLASQARLSQP
ncbi:MAG TPA: bifunctional diguanylate cyclase/phosphodiesterase [Candidatus Dormibacteraeota bacterium]|jgi:diguanylate cyclase (GGDEF)-like protein|nr:bifunctional diguanylate cyclase/phosphodiesterase [Candidatus Dormibacteraeota bacterium]